MFIVIGHEAESAVVMHDPRVQHGLVPGAHRSKFEVRTAKCANSAGETASDFKVELQLVAAERVIPLRGARGLIQFVEVPRLLAMVEDDLLIKVAQVVEHGYRSSPTLRVSFQPFPHQLVQFLAGRGVRTRSMISPAKA